MDIIAAVLGIAYWQSAWNRQNGFCRAERGASKIGGPMGGVPCTELGTIRAAESKASETAEQLYWG